MDDPRGILGGLPLYMSHEALKSLAYYSAEALRYFEGEDYDTAWMEFIKCREAVRDLERIRKEQKAEAARDGD